MSGQAAIHDHEAGILLRRPLPERAARGLLSVVIPCHNERDVIEATHARLMGVLTMAAATTRWKSSRRSPAAKAA